MNILYYYGCTFIHSQCRVQVQLQNIQGGNVLYRMCIFFVASEKFRNTDKEVACKGMAN